jgi:hypothetical protein
MFRQSLFGVGCFAAALLVVPIISAQHASSQDRQLLGPKLPQVQQQRLQGIRPGQQLQVAPGGTGAVLRTHCNGSCMCTGSDCTETWKSANCKDAPVCSSDPGNVNLVCTCVKKVAN